MPLLNNNGYQSEGVNSIRKNTPVVQRQGQANQRATVQYQNSEMTRGSYQPVPDGRFYTKANFFTLRNSKDGIVSEQYQTDAEPGEQEVFEEMMHRRNKLSNIGVVQAPAVPHNQMIGAKSPQSSTASNNAGYFRTVTNPDRSPSSI